MYTQDCYSQVPTVCFSSVRLPCVFRVSVSDKCLPHSSSDCSVCVYLPCCTQEFFSDPGVLPCLHLCLRPTEEFSVPSEPGVLPWLHLCLTVRLTVLHAGVLSVSVLMATSRIQPGRRAKQRLATSKPVCCIIF